MSTQDAGAGLPLNRKERFYTGTVLPMIIAAEDFVHLGRFLRLCGLEDAPRADEPGRGAETIQFFTEYSLVESVHTTDERARFAPLPREKDTPDVVLAGSDWLVAIEAKMFDGPAPRQLAEQTRAQAVVVASMARGLDLPPARVRHVALLPTGYGPTALDVPVIRWEAVLEAYRDVGPRYWLGVLEVALRRYPELVSPATDFSANSDAEMTGGEIEVAYKAGTLSHAWMGRGGGFAGPKLAQDLDSGSWRSRRYQVAMESPGNRNWFAIEDFMRRIDAR